MYIAFFFPVIPKSIIWRERCHKKPGAGCFAVARWVARPGAAPLCSVSPSSWWCGSALTDPGPGAAGLKTCAYGSLPAKARDLGLQVPAARVAALSFGHEDPGPSQQLLSQFPSFRRWDPQLCLWQLENL
jgi:hypothetical protein